jgi:hypothetical protein
MDIEASGGGDRRRVGSEAVAPPQPQVVSEGGEEEEEELEMEGKRSWRRRGGVRATTGDGGEEERRATGDRRLKLSKPRAGVAQSPYRVTGHMIGQPNCITGPLGCVRIGLLGLVWGKAKPLDYIIVILLLESIEQPFSPFQYGINLTLERS